MVAGLLNWPQGTFASKVWFENLILAIVIVKFSASLDLLCFLNMENVIKLLILYVFEALSFVKVEMMFEIMVGFLGF